MIQTWQTDGEYTDYLISCDKCDEEDLIYNCYEWNDLIKSMRVKGWKNQKSNKSDKWLHFCPECATKKQHNPFKKEG